MPTVMRLDGLRVAIYPNDHRPAHVHVIGATGEALFILNCADGPAQLRENYGFDGRALRSIETGLNQALAKLCGDWRIIHADY